MQIGKLCWTAAIALTLSLSGCGGTSDSTTLSGGPNPETVIGEFLAAVKKGDDKQASALLTNVARQKTTEMEMVVAPPGSDTATYKVLESEVEGAEAQVGTDWTDLDADGRPRTDRIVWLLHHEAEGWRIKGMATRVFPDLPPVMLNFEDPEDMLKKQQAAEAEIARRDSQAPATTGEPGTQAAGSEASTVR
jgi:hypothetical protein